MTYLDTAGSPPRPNYLSRQWAKYDPIVRRRIVAGVVAIIALSIILLLIWPKSRHFAYISVPTMSVTVSKRTNLAAIAKQNGVEAIDLQLLNQDVLSASFRTLCKGTNVDRWPEHAFAIYYCNPMLALPEASTLQPGMRLAVRDPSVPSSQRAADLVDHLRPTKGIVLLINADDRQTAFDAADAILMAMRARGLSVLTTNIWAYSPRHHMMTQYLERRTASQVDVHVRTTLQAALLLQSMLATSDQVVLITNETNFSHIGSKNSRPVFGLGLTPRSFKALGGLAHATHGYAG